MRGRQCGFAGTRNIKKRTAYLLAVLIVCYQPQRSQRARTPGHSWSCARNRRLSGNRAPVCNTIWYSPLEVSCKLAMRVRLAMAPRWTRQNRCKHPTGYSLAAEGGALVGRRGFLKQENRVDE